MIKLLFFVGSIFLFCQNSFNQILQVQNTQTPAQLVQNVLLGSGVQAFNITFNGQTANTITNQVAYFTNGNSIGIPSGIIMGSGNVVTTAPGPNNSPSAGTPTTQNYTDPDLAAIAGLQINDAAVLEFDFIATGDTVKFNFVFASEEYPEYVGSFNDAFGFFLSGPGINGPYSNNAINVALIPNTTTPVTINNVNMGNYNCPGPPSGCTNCAYYVDNCTGQFVQYDGYTVPLTAILAPLSCGDTFHIKLAIGDALDQAFDSGVFLQEGSFSSNNITMSSNIDVQSIDSMLYEGCGMATLLLTRSDTTDTLFFTFNISGTATNGVDYNYINTSNYFLPGEDSASFNIWAIVDGQTEGPESVIIQLIQTVCNVNDTQTVTFYIADYDSMQTTPNNPVKVCVDDTVPVFVTLTGGDWPFTYNWTPGNYTSDTIFVSPSNNTYYIVTITDECNKTVTDTVYVSVINHPPLTSINLNDTNLLCPGDTALLFKNISGGSGNPLNIVWYDGSFTYNSNPLLIHPSTTTTYYFMAIDNCSKDTIRDTITVNVPIYPPMSLSLNNDTSICLNDPIQLSALVQGGSGVYYYQWNTGDTTSSITLQLTQTQTLYVNVTDQCGNSANDSVYVYVSPIYPDFTYSPSSPVKINTPVQCTDLSINPVQWQWTVNNGLQSTEQNPSFTFDKTGQYTICLKIKNPDGCESETCKSIEIYEDFLFPNIITPNGDGKNDVLFIKGLQGQNKLIIYNRWGNKIYEIDNYQNDWDGDGHSDGTYYFILIRHNGEEVTGYFTILNK